MSVERRSNEDIGVIILVEENEVNETLSISGKEISCEYKLRDISELKFYRKNPRIATILSMYPNDITDGQIDNILWNKNETHKLFNSIKKDGGLIHPVIIYKNEVLEGNTRLCCYRHLYDTTRDEKWRYIRCTEIFDELDQTQIYRLLCTEHIEGKIEWDAYEKANLCCKMHEEEGMDWPQISEIFGESESNIKNKVRAYKLMVENKIDNKSQYSHLEQLVTNRKISDMKIKDPTVEKKIIDLIKQDKIPKAQDIRKIPDIYKHKKARKRLFEDKEEINQVYHDLKAIAPMTDSPFMKDVEELINKIQYLKRNEREGLKINNRDVAKIEQLTKEMIRLCRELDIKIHVPINMTKG